MEIIPAVDIRKGNCVRLRQGRAYEEIIYSRDPLAMAKRWEREGAKRLHVVDLDAAFLGRSVHRELITKISRKLSIPIQVGGGIRTLKDIQYYLTHGADRIILGTKALEDRKFLSKINKKFLKRTLISLDACNTQLVIRGWTKKSPVPALSFAQELDKIGLAGIIYTDISRDGMLTGPDTKFMLQLLREVSLPVIISGGISSISDIKKIKRLSRNRVCAVIIGQALYAGKIRLKDALSL